MSGPSPTSNFGLLPPELSSWEKSKAVIIPAPFEKSTTYGRGAVNGPRAIIEASANMELYDMELGLEPCDIGIHTLACPTEDEMGSTGSMLAYLEKQTEHALEAGKLPIVLGGEHTVTIGPVRALSKKYPSMTVLSLDAHSDLREEYEGNIHSHACVMRRVLDMCSVVEAGVRSMAAEERPVIEERKVPIFTASDILGGASFIDELTSLLSENVFISIDVDVFDPGTMPSTGTPEPGGLGWYDVLKIVSTVAREKNVLGYDVVELSPMSSNKAPDFLAARLVYKTMGFIFHGGRKG